MMLFRLADRLGMTVTRIEREMTVKELVEWAAFFRITEAKGR